MKIDHLPIGTRFLFKGVEYTKTGPMTAASANGGTQLIPKHAVLAPVPGAAPFPEPPPATGGGRLDRARIAAAFEDYHQTALKLTDATGAATLAAARHRFLAALR